MGKLFFVLLNVTLETLYDIITVYVRRENNCIFMLFYIVQYRISVFSETPCTFLLYFLCTFHGLCYSNWDFLLYFMCCLLLNIRKLLFFTLICKWFSCLHTWYFPTVCCFPSIEPHNLQAVIAVSFVIFIFTAFHNHNGDGQCISFVLVWLP